jgi:MoaA/NifB/PqqE/SkfB family radical SAM enzyme
MPLAPFGELRTLWFQITGTLCNLACRHCLNASGPRSPWLAGLDAGDVRRHVAEADALGVKEIYFTGGEPLLHPELLALLGAALGVAPTTMLTNGTLIDEGVAEGLAALAAASEYSLEIRVSLDGTTAEENDAVRGAGSFALALGALRLLDARGLHPIVTFTEIASRPGAPDLYDRARALLTSLGLARPRVKILPLFPVGRLHAPRPIRLPTDELLADVDRSTLQCAEGRVVAAGGIYCCPILTGLPAGRIDARTLAEAARPTPLVHPACVTCVETGASCRNF